MHYVDIDTCTRALIPLENDTLEVYKVHSSINGDVREGLIQIDSFFDGHVEPLFYYVRK
jgi:hypothetical protein